MTISTGVNKEVAYKEEAVWGTAPGITSPAAQLIRRVSFDLDMERRSFESREVRPDLQVADMRLGTKMPRGTLVGELSCGTYADWIGAVLRRRFAAGATTSAQTNISAQASPAAFLRASGSFLTDGFKIGDIVTPTGFTGAGADNNGKRFRVTGVAALTLSVATSDSETIDAVAAGDSVTIAVAGQKTYIPAAKSDQLDLSYSIENWFGDITKSELFTGVKWGSMRVRVPASGMAEIEFSAMARNKTRANSRYFTSPLDVSDTPILASPTGKIRLAGEDRLTVTALDFAIEANYQAPEVAGSLYVPDIIEGRARITGNMTVLFEDDDIAALFENETETDLQVYLTESESQSDDGIQFVMNRIKLGGARKSDGEQALSQTIPFTGLIKTEGSGAGTAYDRTTIAVIDTSLS